MIDIKMLALEEFCKDNNIEWHVTLDTISSAPSALFDFKSNYTGKTWHCRVSQFDIMTVPYSTEKG